MCREGDSAETVATTCGRAIPGMETRIAVRDDRAGELLVRGDYVMLGYLDDPAATAEAIDADGWLHTGDVGVLDDDGNLSITDRLKDMYISGGFNVYPAEVEQALARMDGVADVAVVGVPDERMGEVGKAYVVGTAAPDDVIAFAKERLANFKVPRHVELVDALPRNLSGKVLKTELRKYDGPDPVRVRAGLPGRGPGLARGQRAGRAAAVDGHRRRLRRPPGVGEAALRRPLVGRVLADGVLRSRGVAGRVGDLRGGVLPRRRARPGLARTASSCSPRSSSTTAPRSSRTGSCRRWRPASRSGRSAGPSPRPGPTWRRCARPRPATTSAAAGCSTARRPGRRARPSPTGASGSSAPTPRRRATTA